MLAAQGQEGTKLWLGSLASPKGSKALVPQGGAVKLEEIERRGLVGPQPLPLPLPPRSLAVDVNRPLLHQKLPDLCNFLP